MNSKGHMSEIPSFFSEGSSETDRKRHSPAHYKGLQSVLMIQWLCKTTIHSVWMESSHKSQLKSWFTLAQISTLQVPHSKPIY